MFRVIPDFPLYEMDLDQNVRNRRTKRIRSPHRGGDTIRLYDENMAERSRKILKLFYHTYPEEIPGKTLEPYTGYRILKDGNILSLHTSENLSPADTKDGYKVVSLQIGDTGEYTSELVHRLVAKTYIPMDSTRPDVNHKDGDKANNVYTNLEWCTKSENLEHAVATGLYDTKMRRCSLTKGGVTHYFDSTQEAADFLDYSPGTLRTAMARNAEGVKPSRGTVGKYTCKGYIPEYIIEDAFGENPK